MIRSIADYRVGICPFKVNKCDAVTDTLLLHGAAEQYTEWSFCSGCHCNDMYYFIWKNVETYQIEPFPVLSLAVRKQSCDLIRAHDESSRTSSAQFPESRRRFCNIYQRGSFLYLVFHSNTYFPKNRLFLLKTWAQARSSPCWWTHSKCLYGGAIPLSAAFAFARDHPQGLKGCAMAFIWVPWFLVIQTENCLTTS